MKNNFLQKKIIFLANKLKSLREELQISKEIIHLASSKIEEIYRKERNILSEEQKIEEPTNKDIQQKTASPQSPLEQKLKNNKPDTLVKKLFRKIALKIHPDKLGSELSKNEKQIKIDMFLMAQKALLENDIIILSDIAINLEIELPNISKIEIKKTEKEISDIKKQLNDIESKLVWKWFATEDEQEKEKILSKIFSFLDERQK